MSFYESLVEWFLEDKLGNHQAQQKKKKNNNKRKGRKTKGEEWKELGFYETYQASFL